jgi:hypothetical protein
MARAADPVGRHLPLKLGKKPARPGAVKFKLANYLEKLKLPTPPKVFGHEGLIGANWEMLGNDQYGDCVWAGAAHETMLWNKEAARTVTFNNQSVLKDYSAVTGFNPNDPNTDQGTDMQVAASYRRKTGVRDAAGKRHKVIAYLALTTEIQINWRSLFICLVPPESELSFRTPRWINSMLASHGMSPRTRRLRADITYLVLVGTQKATSSLSPGAKSSL